MILKNINTDLLPIINVGLYGTTLGEYLIESVPDYECNTMKEIENEICRVGEKIINKTLKSISEYVGKININNVKFESPKFYNYYNDILTFDMEVEDDLVCFIKNIIKKSYDVNDFELFLKDNYKSYDGFISFMPSDLDKFMNENIDWKIIIPFIMYIIIEIKSINLMELQEIFEDEIMEFI